MNLDKIINTIASYLPVVKPPEKELTFKEKLKHTIIILTLFFLLSSIPLFGISENISSQLQELAWVLGSNIGTLATLGIGPIVVAGIILQLLVGGGILNINIFSDEGRIKYMNYLKVFILIFTIIESLAILIVGTLRPDMTLGISPILLYILIFIQLFLGSYFIYLLDDYATFYGLTSGINLFILGTLSKALIIRFLNPFSTTGDLSNPSGILINGILSFFNGDFTTFLISISVTLATLAILILAAYLQTIEVEIPAVLIRVQGKSIRYPIKLLYTSVIPVILLYAFIVQIEFLYMKITGSNTPPSILQAPAVLYKIFVDYTWLFDPFNILHIIVYLLIYVIGAAILSWMWIHAAGMDAESIAMQLVNTPLLQGRDPRIIKKSLEKFIEPISILSGILVGFLAAISNILGAALAGTSLLLLVMISYMIVEELKQKGYIYQIPILKKLIKVQDTNKR